MPKKRSNSESPITTNATQPSISGEAALSFLKDTKGAVIWSIRDLADTLKISRRDAEQVIALLAAQGYVKPADKGEWMTTPAGESVSGAKLPRFSRESVEQAVESLKDRIRQVNKDPNAPFKITGAVAFGDLLLTDRPRVQAADVGVGLVQPGETSNEVSSAFSVQEERRFLRRLRGRTPLLHIRTFADWMRRRSYLDLL
jgi:biotin operon repressor